MPSNQVEQIIRKLPALGWIGKTVSYSLHRAVLNGSEQVRTLADFLHGTWLKHPLHPVLTDVTLGAWMFGGFFDLLGFVTRSKRATDAADMLTAVGTASAIPTALAGLADFSTIKEDAMEEGTLHGVTNMFVFLLFVLSSSARLKGKRARGSSCPGWGWGSGRFPPGWEGSWCTSDG